MGIRCALIINLSLTDMERKTVSISEWPRVRGWLGGNENTILRIPMDFPMKTPLGIRNSDKIPLIYNAGSIRWEYDYFFVMRDGTIHAREFDLTVHPNELKDHRLFLRLWEYECMIDKWEDFVNAYCRACQRYDIVNKTK